MTLKITSLLFCLLALPVTASTLYWNGKILKEATPASAEEWMVVSDGKIDSIGKGELPVLPGDAKKVDLKGAVVMAGLTDSHVHAVETGRGSFIVDLRGSKSAADAAKRVQDFVALHPELKNRSIEGVGWDQADWPGKQYPTRDLLDKISDTQPILLERIDGHALWTNTFSLKKAEIWEQKKNPEGGEIVRGKDGKPSGVCVDAAALPLLDLYSKPTDEEFEKYISKAVEQALPMGITAFHDADATATHIRIFKKLLRDKKLRFRFYAFHSSLDDKELDVALDKGPLLDQENGMLTVRTVKLYIDGAMGSRGAAFEEPYDDEPKTKGLLRMDGGALTQKIKKIDAAGFQVAVHAIGSLGNKVVLDAIEKGMENPKTKRPRLEHAQVMNKDDITRAAKLGVIASMQPVHCTTDKKWVVDRIGKERAKFAYAWKAFLDAGVTLAFGSDSPVDDMNPWHGVFAALTRQDKDGQPPKGFYPEQRVTLETALTAYTKGAAIAAFRERISGTLDRGKVADFIILKKNPYELKATEVKDMQVEATYIGGEKVWPK